MKPRSSSILFGLLGALLISSARVLAHTPAEEMAQAASNFLFALDDQQQAKCGFDLKADERYNWHFIPKPRKGLPLAELKPAQRQLAQGLLATGLSQRGYMKISTIMSLEQVLFELEQNKGPKRDPEMYFISIFGKPQMKAAWGWRFEGHHMSLNFLVGADQSVSVTPSFLGSNPGEVRTGPRKGLRVLAAEEDLARQLVKSLSDEQRKTAIYTNVAPGDIITAADRKAHLLSPTGLNESEMNPAQRGLLTELLKEYVYRYRGEIADKDLQKIEKSGPEKIYFAWAGSTEPGQPHYYRLQGPSFLMEYDNTQNNANHIHAVWRDLESDFGDDLLLRHYEESPHAK